MVTTESELIDRLGGNSAVAALFDVKHNTVSGWRSRGFPPWAAVRLQAEAKRTEIDVDPALFAINRPKQRVA